MSNSNNPITLLDALQIRFSDDKFNIHPIFNSTPKFKLFLEFYKFGKENENKTYFFFSPLVNKVTTFGEWKFPENMGGNFISSYGHSDQIDIIEFRDDIYNEIYDDDGTGNKEIRENFLPIADCNSSMMLLLGYNGDYVDQIYLDLINEEPRIRFISENIFEFCRDTILKIQPLSFNFIEEKLSIKFNNNIPSLYKNFEEDFYRIKEDGDVTSIIEKKNQYIANLEQEMNNFNFRIRLLARNEKKLGISLDIIAEKYGFTIEELSSQWF
jgi:hypothetical protein